MPRTYPAYPSVSAALASVRSATFRGNTFGQVDSYNTLTEEDREMASNYDVKRALEAARQARHLAGLDQSN